MPQSSSSERSKPAISRRTTGFWEPYLSYVLPVGTASRRWLTASVPLARRSSPWRGPASAPVVRSRSVVGLPGLVVRRLDAELQLDAPDAFERALLERAHAGEDVAHHAERRQLHGGDEQHRAEDQRLDVARALALDDVEVGEAAPDDRRGEPERSRPAS